ncbi:hypothetical protein ABB37_00555 [Leptomonas pyrrhocoris]|uniref:EF-hand domain-containing protein n=1 Tax=Leptomonas pyrrhocoris TaxID=157538 RepID=A0A0M9GAU9_LEPPY|nr:hypothetical protein ABB37_00555 [Leptomonas pyrrhocoris]XP_015664799.1 hypothetical protein ABB37_00555 [Leptomonas pyrrhocoris]KPA86359.1 hypothetical protein ABB37_00555 [Leptomonas pyrrhocoris]KPA86360.1 hypothetical protein ABB37_00555 [Leptomonas pyrrhocoris]|eukprot:XP_015664798.1 hypothetical protein ABB37_00555 [Leptomonas pyrrhocoris]
MSVKNTFGTQAAKTLCANLYATWLSEEANVERIREAMNSIIALSAAKANVDAAIVNGVAKAGTANDKRTKVVEVGSSGSSANNGSPTTTNGAQHKDPAAGLSTSAALSLDPDLERAHSPQPSVPSSTKFTEDGSSPNASSTSPGSAGRLPGVVDELDYPHRAGSPVIAPGSPQPKPVVDPSAPLPHVASGTTSPHAVHSLGSPRLDTTLNAAMVSGDLAPPPLDMTQSLSATMRESSTRFVHTSGAFATTPPSNVKQASLNDIPCFYSKKESRGLAVEADTEEVQELNRLLEKNDPVKKTVWVFGDISSKVFKVPIWYKEALFKDIATRSGLDAAVVDSLTAAQIRTVYKDVYAPLSVSRRLYELICTHPKKEFITLSDLESMGKYLVAAHPGLQFLQQPEFQEYYWHTVAVRIMYTLERQQCGRIYWRDFDRSDLPERMMELDAKDVNLVLDYFSYEHFYVLYCKFWELDTDRDLLVGYEDLCNYGQGSVVTGVIKRVVEGYGRPLSSGVPGKLDFEDFVYFCLSEEDKNSEPAVLYWFKVLDVDEDGLLSGYEMMTYFEENQQRFLEFSDSPDGDISYEDTMCQMLDMIGFDRVKTRKCGVTLGDLRSCPSPANFFNMIFNASKFMLFEHRDPFGEHQMRMRPEKTDWDRFARAEYDRMAAEAQ